MNKQNKEIICTFCHTPIDDVKNDMVICNGCGTPYHKECWDELDVCATYGCNSTTCHNVFDVDFEKHNTNNSHIDICIDTNDVRNNNHNKIYFNISNENSASRSKIISKIIIFTVLIIIIIFAIKGIVYYKSVKYVNENYEIADGILQRYIGDSTKAYIPYWETKIGINTFDESDYLKEINVSKFNKLFASDDGILYYKSFTTLSEAPNGKTVFNISNKTKYIECRAFKDCKYLTKINLPNNIESIGEYAFYNCQNLKEIQIPNNVKKIKAHTFEYCTSLEKVTIPNSVNEICEHAFFDCANLKEINIPNNVTKIGNSAFYNCSNLKELKIPSKVTSIEDEAFFNCSKLERIYISNGVTQIGWRTFSDCYSLKEITIPKSVKHISFNAFSNCTNLKVFKCPYGLDLTDIFGYTYKTYFEYEEEIPEYIHKFNNPYLDSIPRMKTYKRVMKRKKISKKPPKIIRY